MHITKQKKPIWKGYISYDSNYMAFWEGQDYGNQYKESVKSWGVGDGRDE